MPLRGKVDDKSRPHEIPSRKDKHAAWLDFAALAGLTVCLIILWKRLFELEGNAFAHYTTELTVFTSASALASSKLPVL